MGSRYWQPIQYPNSAENLKFYMMPPSQGAIRSVRTSNLPQFTGSDILVIACESRGNTIQDLREDVEQFNVVFEQARNAYSGSRGVKTLRFEIKEADGAKTVPNTPTQIGGKNEQHISRSDLADLGSFFLSLPQINHLTVHGVYWSGDHKWQGMKLESVTTLNLENIHRQFRPRVQSLQRLIALFPNLKNLKLHNISCVNDTDGSSDEELALYQRLDTLHMFHVNVVDMQTDSSVREVSADGTAAKLLPPIVPRSAWESITVLRLYLHGSSWGDPQAGLQEKILPVAAMIEACCTTLAELSLDICSSVLFSRELDLKACHALRKLCLHQSTGRKELATEASGIIRRCPPTLGHITIVLRPYQCDWRGHYCEWKDWCGGLREIKALQDLTFLRQEKVGNFNDDDETACQRIHKEVRRAFWQVLKCRLLFTSTSSVPRALPLLV